MEINDEQTIDSAPQRIKVAVRVRPLLPHERTSGDDGQRVVADVEKAAVNVFGEGGNCKTFKFD